MQTTVINLSRSAAEFYIQHSRNKQLQTVIHSFHLDASVAMATPRLQGQHEDRLGGLDGEVCVSEMSGALTVEVRGRKEICLSSPEGAIRCHRSISVQWREEKPPYACKERIILNSLYSTRRDRRITLWSKVGYN